MSNSYNLFVHTNSVQDSIEGGSVLGRETFYNGILTETLNNGNKSIYLFTFSYTIQYDNIHITNLPQALTESVNDKMLK